MRPKYWTCLRRIKRPVPGPFGKNVTTLWDIWMNKAWAEGYADGYEVGYVKGFFIGQLKSLMKVHSKGLLTAAQTRQRLKRLLRQKKAPKDVIENALQKVID